MHWDWNSLARKQEKVGIYLNLVFIIYVSVHPAMPWVQRFSELNIAQKVNLDNHIVANDFVRTVTTKQKLGLRLDKAATRTMGFIKKSGQTSPPAKTNIRLVKGKNYHDTAWAVRIVSILKNSLVISQLELGNTVTRRYIKTMA